MKPRSAKNKGKRLQNAIRDLILEHFPQLEPDDVVSTLMGDSGTDIKLSPAARKVFPYSPECKNQEKVNIWAALEQAEDRAYRYGQKNSVLVYYPIFENTIEKIVYNILQKKKGIIDQVMGDGEYSETFSKDLLKSLF